MSSIEWRRSDPFVGWLLLMGREVERAMYGARGRIGNSKADEASVDAEALEIVDS